MCPKTETLQYVIDSYRYDERTHNVLYRFIKYGRISECFTPLGKHHKNICTANLKNLVIIFLKTRFIFLFSYLVLRIIILFQNNFS